MSTKEKAFNRFLDSNQCKNRQKLQQCVRESSKADKQILRYENVDCSHKDSWLLLCPDHHSSESHSLVTTIQVVRILNTFYFYRLPGEPFIAEGNYLLGHVVTITPFYFPLVLALWWRWRNLKQLADSYKSESIWKIAVTVHQL